MKKLLIVSIEGGKSNTERVFFNFLFKKIDYIYGFLAVEPNIKNVQLRVIPFVQNELDSDLLDSEFENVEPKLFVVFDDDKHEINFKNQNRIVEELKKQLSERKLIKEDDLIILRVPGHKIDDIIYALFTNTPLKELKGQEIANFIRQNRIKKSINHNNKLETWLSQKLDLPLETETNLLNCFIKLKKFSLNVLPECYIFLFDFAINLLEIDLKES